MRSLAWALSIFFIYNVSAAAESTALADLSGSWIFTWDGDDKNTNPVNLKHEAGTITGVYINDSRESCPVAGRLSSPADVVLVVMCPGWDIKAEGSITSPSLVTGKYFAYGDSTGEYKMSRK